MVKSLFTMTVGGPIAAESPVTRAETNWICGRKWRSLYCRDSGRNMDEHVTTRPNYYDMLGIKPGASPADIERAFARAVSAFTPRAFGSVAMLSVAFETLHNPAKRRVYDQSIGLGPPPPLKSLAVRASGTLSFIGSGETASRLAHLDPLPRASEPAHPPEPEAVIDPPPAFEPAPALDALEAEALAEEARSEARIGAFLAESQRIADLEPHVEPYVEPHVEQASPPVFRPVAPPPPAEPAASADFRPVAPPVRDIPVPPPENETAPAGLVFDPDAYADEDPERRNLKIIGLGAGAMVVGAALLGAWAGLDANDQAAVAVPETQSELNVPLPPAEVGSQTTDNALGGPLGSRQAAQVKPAKPSQNSRPRVLAPPPVDLANSLIEQEGRVSRLSLIEQSLPATGEAAAPVEAESAPPAPVTAARMPLGNATIASTLRRIGYPCGSVASTAASGGSGVFVVNCTSGHSYRAAPSGGRYRFRKI